jgi:hypothetical protein
VSKAFVLCRQIIEDRHTGEYVLLVPTADIAVAGFPAILTLSVFARWTSAHGVYEIEVQVQDLEGHVVCGLRQEKPLECQNPLATGFLAMNGLQMFFPRPGKYDLVILANNEEVVRDSVHVHLLNQPAG